MAKGRWWLIAGTISALVATTSGQVWAQPAVGPIPIALGQELAGVLEPGDAKPGSEGLYDDFAFQVEAGRRVQIALEATGDFDPVLFVGQLDAKGQLIELGRNDDRPGGGLDSQLTFTAPTTGVFIARATALSATGQGGYRIALSEVPPPAVARRIEVGAQIDGQLSETDGLNDDGRRVAHFQLEGRAGQGIVVDLRSEAFDTYLELFREIDGRLVSIGYNDDAASPATDSRLSATLTHDGLYRIEARAFGPVPVLPAAYQLSLEVGVADPGWARMPATDPPAAPPGPPMRALSAEARALGESMQFDEALPLYEAEAAACLDGVEDEVECFDLVLEAGLMAQAASAFRPDSEGRLKSEAHLRRAVEIASRSFPPDDFRLARAGASLALQLSLPLSGRPEETPARLAEAETLVRAALSAFPARDEYPFDTWEQTLQGILALTGRQAESNAILSRRLAAERARWGDNHRFLWQPLRDLAIGLGAAGDARGAVAAWNEAVLIMSAEFPADDSQRLAVQAGLASALIGIGDYAGAARIYAGMQAVMGPIGEDSSMLDFIDPSYVDRYASMLTALGRRREALIVMEARVSWLLRLLGPTHPATRAAGANYAGLALEEGQTETAAALLEVLVRLSVQEEGVSAVGTLLTRSRYAMAMARSGDRSGALADAEVSLAGLRPAASQTPSLLVVPLWLLGGLKLEDGQIDAARAHHSEAVAIETRRWCPTAARSGRPDWQGGDDCRPDPGLTGMTALAARAELHGTPRPGRAARLYAHAGDMALARTRLRFSADPQARKDFNGSRPIHSGFVTAAWTVNDPEAARRIASEPVRTDLSTIIP